MIVRVVLWAFALVLLKSSNGRAQAAATKARRAQLPDLYAVYKAKLPNITPGVADFEWTLLRGGSAKPLNIDSAVESVEWRDEQSVLQGSIGLRRPIPDDPTSLPIGRGHRVRCRVKYDGKMVELWQMRVLIPDVDPATGTVTCELLDDLDLLRRDVRDWNLRAGKRRPKGMRSDVMARQMLKGYPVGRLPQGKAYIKKLKRSDRSRLDMLRLIYKEEREETHRRYIVRWENGKVAVKTYQRNRVLYIFEHEITEALLTVEGEARPFTVIEAKGKIGKGKDAKTITHVEARRDIVARFGRAVEQRNYGRVTSLAALKAKARRSYAANLRLKYKATVTVPGVPFIRRGEGIEVRIPSEGYTGDDAMVYTTRVVHRVDSGGYWTEMDVNRVDPFEKDKARVEKELREAKAAKRKAAS